MIWGGFGYNSLIMLAGLLSIPKDYYEAAQIDGATPWKRLFKITIPNTTKAVPKSGCIATITNIMIVKNIGFNNVH